MASKFLSVLCIFLLSVTAFAAGPIASSESLATTEKFKGITKFNLTLFGFQFLLFCTKNIGPITVPIPLQESDVLLQCGENKILSRIPANTFGFGFMIAPQSQFIRFLPFEVKCKFVVNETRTDCGGMGPASGRGRLESGLKVDKVLQFGNVKLINYVAKGFHYKEQL